MDTAIVEYQTMDLSALDGIGKGSDATDVLTSSDVLKDTSVEKVLSEADQTKNQVKPEEKKSEIIAEEKPVLTKEGEQALDIAAQELNPEITDTKPQEKPEKGRPKIDKSAMVSYLSGKIQAEEFGIPEDSQFDPQKQTLDQYLTSLPEKELHDLLDANWKVKEDEIKAKTPTEFFDALPEELQYAAKYVAEGGQDLKALFKALSYVEEVREMDPAKEEDQVPIVRSYLRASSQLTDEQIDEQIADLKDANKIAKRAQEYKPFLDQMQKEQVDAHIKAAENQRKQQAELAQYYTQHVHKALEKNELAGIKLDKKFSRDIANNMIGVTAGPFSGKPVNWLGYGLEKAQYVEPDFEAVMLASWILNDKKTALEEIRKQGATQQTDKIQKLIKIGQGIGTTEAPTLQEQKPVRRLPNMSNVLRRTA